ANNNTWTGNISLANGAAIGGITATTLTISGVLSGTDLTKVGQGNVTLAAVNTASGNLTVVSNLAAGTLTLANTNAFAGAVAVGGALPGTLLLGSFGTLANASSVTVNPGSTLTLDNQNAAV